MKSREEKIRKIFNKLNTKNYNSLRRATKHFGSLCMKTKWNNSSNCNDCTLAPLCEGIEKKYGDK